MKQYFGTDGIRGEANVLLTPLLALKVGEYLAYKFKDQRWVIGKDPRQSSDMLEHALASGLASQGGHVYLMGVCSTPALAYVIKEKGFKGGVMISASHNPYHDNGLKVFSDTGLKIPESLEREIESYIRGEITLEMSKDIGFIKSYPEGLQSYIQKLESTIDVRLDGLKIVLDLANGSATTSAQKIFEDLGATVITMNHQPDGININNKAGSTHMSYIQNEVVKSGADVGFAFDGDADRVLASDHLGNLVDGDKIIYILANAMKEKGFLKKNTVVTTVMSNLGFLQSMKKSGIKVITTDVGDRHVAKEMFDNDYLLGGEQSGHILLKDYATTGDGILTALKLTEILIDKNMDLHSLSASCASFPQHLENIYVDNKHEIMQSDMLKEKIEELQSLLGENGRILVRASGTEPMVRVMVEAKTDILCTRLSQEIGDLIKNL